MATTLHQFLEQVRRDLGDTDPVNARWSNEDLERHLRHALQELAVAIPRQVKATLTTTSGSRDLDISTLADRVGIEAVEYPTGDYPPTYVPFSLWSDTLTLLVETAPAGAESVHVYWYALHTLTPEGTTVPPWAEYLLPLGAAAYAALEWASLATNRVNTGGPETGRDYLAWGQERLAAFQRGLAQHARWRAARINRLYLPDQPKPSQRTDWGP